MILKFLTLQVVSFYRETNKAFCGFIDQSKYCQYERVFQDKGLDDRDDISRNDILVQVSSEIFLILFQKSNEH